MKDALEWMKSPAGQKSMEEYFEKLAKKDAIERARAQRIKDHFTDAKEFDQIKPAAALFSFSFFPPAKVFSFDIRKLGILIQPFCQQQGADPVHKGVWQRESGRPRWGWA